MSSNEDSEKQVVINPMMRLVFLEATVSCLLDELHECRIIDPERFGKKIEELLKSRNLTVPTAQDEK